MSKHYDIIFLYSLNKIIEFFPTKYEHARGPELEVYWPGDPSSEDYKYEVWIPVIEKA